jgi:hypothetical protein
MNSLQTAMLRHSHGVTIGDRHIPIIEDWEMRGAAIGAKHGTAICLNIARDGFVYLGFQQWPKGNRNDSVNQSHP